MVPGKCHHLNVKFDSTVRGGGRGRILVPVPFDPDEAWQPKPRHHVGGTIDGRRVRGVIERLDGEWALVMGPAWQRDCGLEVGRKVKVELEPEGPQRTDLAEDLAAALAANPEAGAFFDGLAQFYRKGYLRWIESTKRSPEERARRIARTVELLTEGVKDYRQG
jgi:Bacteriocin-protection, YdeI or OmpD-Associated/Domain of unknown function (DUF1905)